MPGSEEKVTAYLGLGSNLGDRRESLGAAVETLNARPHIQSTTTQRDIRSADWRSRGARRSSKADHELAWREAFMELLRDDEWFLFRPMCAGFTVLSAVGAEPSA